jgi:hypothetical protein
VEYIFVLSYVEEKEVSGTAKDVALLAAASAAHYRLSRSWNASENHLSSLEFQEVCVYLIYEVSV